MTPCIYMFNEERNNVVLEYRFTHYVKAGLSLHWAHIQCRILLSYWCMFHFNEPRLEKTAAACKLGYIVQFLSFLNMVDVFWGCTTRFLMDLVENPKADRFSRGVATALKITQCTSVCSFLTFVTEISSRFSLKYLQDLVSSI